MTEEHRSMKPAELPVKIGDVLTLVELDDAVHEVQKFALAKGMIPISSILSEPLGGDKHRVLGAGHNHLRDGIPGVHGETGAIISMGRREIGYAGLVATSSLSPCPFCQSCLARHLGIKTVRILDNENYVPDKSGYAAAGISPIIKPHRATEVLFKSWVEDPRFRILWNRDIGISEAARHAPYVPPRRELWEEYLSRAHRLAREAADFGEAPIGAVIVDEFGEVAGCGHSRIASDNDPSKTAAVTAWRNCGSRDDWGRHTLVLSAGADHIAYSMFKIFGFGQLVIGSVDVFAGQTAEVAKIVHTRDRKMIPVHIMGDHSSDALLRDWLERVSPAVAREFLGADWSSVTS